MASLASCYGLQCRKHTDHAHTVSSIGIVPVLALRARRSHRVPKRSLLILSSLSNNSSSSRDGNKQASAPSSSLSPAKLLHTLEFTAIAIAAVGQAALLISTALCQWRQTQQLSELQDQLHSMDDTLAEAAAAGTPTAKTSSRHQHDAHQNPDAVQLQQYQAAVPAVPHAAHAGLHLLTGSALVVGLLCGAGLRQLQLRHPLLQGSSGLKPSRDAAVRLAALEVVSQQTAAQLTNTARQMDKLQARVRLATSDLKQPIRETQGAAAQQAAALLKLSQQQASLQQQLDGSQELIGALQGLAAKQFKVSAEALQSLKQGQAQLSSSSTKAIKELQRQQQALQQQIQAQQQQVQALRQLSTSLQRQQQAALGTQQPWNGTGTAAAAGESGDSSSSSGVVATPPDPWRPRHAAGASNGGNSSSSSSQSGNSSLGSVLRSATDDSSHGYDQGPSSNGRAPSNGIPRAGLNGASPTTAAAAN